MPVFITQYTDVVVKLREIRLSLDENEICFLESF